MNSDKSPDAFRTISEVASSLDLPQHVLRFWETRFSHIRPLKRGGGRRYYRPEDVELLRGIRHLLYNEGYTIKGVQRILKEQGPRFVMQIWREDAVTLSAEEFSRSRHEADDDDDTYEVSESRHSQAEQGDDAANLVKGAGEAPRGVIVGDDPARQVRSGTKLMGRILGDKAAGGGKLTKDEVRKLQATLFELLECKRILDQAR
ncbi:MerR family transcriptional regulator [Stappia sp. F7233]|uniref:MerR family transcriptional regulator n=1 Tax=Stappia albiluteola TaxID=2758565 RepID=A0A839ABG4_9HYPH|nr:MerR family transcriptional regulator [Stappia albiluteola]MBA5776292.1 MerR family transcriptional regulator [Stappia albiluteola]